MVIVIPGLSESRHAVDNRITNFKTTGTALSVEVASSARRARGPGCQHPSSRRYGQCQCRRQCQC